jgi:hypothetical protein
MQLALEALRDEWYGTAEELLVDALAHSKNAMAAKIDEIASMIEHKFNTHRHPELYTLAVWVRSMERNN